ncbi:DUF2911 domain-containing protein [Larkinella rosea]|uniref:DUF2911 domain-containing protein n=1 Tax=Larkinella rosea TaxID=2025312 RepID=A0A3P1C439_9BACT|nr:DUF2911 domain-containing protein [Larkinella rosea]RRB07564.1 DUF2911 domain-containing protein [Larkinella rosea]
MKARFIFLFLLIAIYPVAVSAQQLTAIPGGGNKAASVSEQIGLTSITIRYNRPGVKGREGKIWGTSVAHYGLVDPGFGSSKAAPWRAGANENTTISFSDEVKVEGKSLPAGTYGLHMLLGEAETTVIFSKNATSWGSFFYEPSEDALRVTVKNQSLDKSVEWLKYEFIDQTDNAATVALEWEKRMIPFRVEADVVKNQIASFKKELRNSQGFTWQSFVQAATYCVQNKTDLDQALVWADQAVSLPFIGQKNFQTLSTKAMVLVALHKQADADVVMKEAVPMGNMNELHQYARTLLQQKRAKDAYEVFKVNYDKNPNVFTTNVGMGRGLSALGDFKKALPYLKAALPQAPNELNKNSVAGMIKKLEEGKDANS